MKSIGKKNKGRFGKGECSVIVIGTPHSCLTFIVPTCSYTRQRKRREKERKGTTWVAKEGDQDHLRFQTRFSREILSQSGREKD